MFDVLLSCFGGAGLLVGVKLFGDKNAKHILNGFYACLVAQIAWLIWAILERKWTVVITASILIILYARGVYNWKNATAYPIVKTGERNGQ